MISLVTYADQFYMQHACVLVASLSGVADPDQEYRFYLMYSNCDEETLRKVDLTIAKLPANIQVELVECNFGLAGKLKAKKDFLNDAIYDKLLIYEQLPARVTKVVFVDADIVLLKDPARLFEVDLGDHVLGAVREKLYLLPDQDPEKNRAKLRSLGLTDLRQFFNSGVMLIDMVKWREQRISRRALKFAIENWETTDLHDQDAFNAIVQGNWLAISPLWNPRPLNEISEEGQDSRIVTNWEVYEDSSAYLVHYSGHRKPWLYKSNHPRKQDYLHYLRQTGFRDYQFPDYSFRTLLVKTKNAIMGKLRGGRLRYG